MNHHDQLALDDLAKERAELSRRERLIRAFAAGEPVQIRLKGDTTWINATRLSWLWEHYEYRVKPKPEEFFLTVYGDASRFGRIDPASRLTVGGTYNTASYARGACRMGGRVFKLTEVLPE